MLQHARLSVVVIVLTLAAVPMRGDDEVDGSVNIDELSQQINTAWQDRAEEFTNVDVRLTINKSVLRKKHLKNPETPTGTLARIARRRLEFQNTETNTECRYLVDRSGRIRYDYVGDKSYTWVFNGTERESLFREGGEHDFPVAEIGSTQPDKVGARNFVGRLARTLPIRLIYCTFDEAIGVLNPQPLQVVRRGSAGGDGPESIEIECIQYGVANARVWVDPTRGFLPTRFARYSPDGQLEKEYQMQYTRDDADQWTIEAWAENEFDEITSGEAGPSTTYSVDVSELVIHSNVDESMYHIEYPIGTWVSNVTTGVNYIITESGEHREVHRGEYDGTNYKYLLSSPPPQQKHALLWGMPWGHILLVAINVAGVSLLLLYLRRRKLNLTSEGSESRA